MISISRTYLPVLPGERSPQRDSRQTRQARQAQGGIKDALVLRVGMIAFCASLLTVECAFTNTDSDVSTRLSGNAC
jgi:hypothetical protein